MEQKPTTDETVNIVISVSISIVSVSISIVSVSISIVNVSISIVSRVSRRIVL